MIYFDAGCFFSIADIKDGKSSDCHACEVTKVEEAVGVREMPLVFVVRSIAGTSMEMN